MFKRELETRLYQRELERLKKQVNELTVKLQDANKYKMEYQSLCNQYKNNLNELNALKRQTEQLQQKLRSTIDKLENNE